MQSNISSLASAPELFHPVDDESRIAELKGKAAVTCIDTLHKQFAEFVKLSSPGAPYSPEEMVQEVQKRFPNPDAHAIYVYYPWRKTLVKIVEEALFKAIRTNRNKLKIKAEEQAIFEKATIGVVGLSVGNAVAVTLAMERVGGTLVLADYDELEVSNLNRLRAGLCDLDLPKDVIAARQIAEIDPFVKVVLFTDGITDTNIDAFINTSGGLDILVEVCDALPLKYALRRAARAKGIPVVMDTNDRGMVDIERFDSEPDRPVFHGLVNEDEFNRLESYSPAQRIDFVTRLVGGDSMSDRLKASMPEIGKSLTSWPQLASGVMLGGAATAHVCRAIFSGNDAPSGRYYIDMDAIFRQP